MARKKSRNIPTVQNNHQQAVQVAEHRTITGPLPSSEEMAKYKKIDPTLVDRIITMAEKEASNRHTIEDKTLSANISIKDKQFAERKLGQFFGFGIGALGLACSFSLAYVGAENAASIVGGATVLGLVSVFVTGQITSKNKQE